MRALIILLVGFFLLFNGCITQLSQQLLPEQLENADNEEEINEITIEPGVIGCEWTKDDGTRIEDGGVPYAYKTKDDNIRLYYCASDNIVSAISSDGITFEKEDGVRIESGTGYEAVVCDPTIVELPDGRIRMYYKGGDSIGGPGESIHKVFSAVSSDGLNFEKEGIIIDSEKTDDNGFASVPEAIKLPDGRVRIYYVSGDTRSEIVSAISYDGLNFSKEEGVRVSTFVDPAVIILPNGKYLMLASIAFPDKYTNYLYGIYGFFSEDGLEFTQLGIILSEKGVFDPSIIKISEENGTAIYKVFYGKYVELETGNTIVIKSITGRCTVSNITPT